MNRILVTGGAGYIGAVLVPKLLAEGYQVSVLDLFLFADEGLFPEEAIKRGQLTLFRGDMCNATLVRRALEGTDCVINLAGISNDPSSDLDPELTRRINITATRQLVDLARNHGVRRFINASSSSVYGIREERDVTEELPLRPLTVYSESKQVIEQYLREEKGSMTGVSIRSATVCGFSPRMRLDLTVNLLTHHALTKGKITVFGGNQKRPNIHIEDITDLYTLLVEFPEELINGREFNVCSANHTVMHLAEMVRNAVSPDLPIEIVPTNDQRSYHISAGLIRERLGFVPQHSVEEAIHDVMLAFRSGRIPDPDQARYYNVKLMKQVLSEQQNVLAGT